jgi:hypothetical protein
MIHQDHVGDFAGCAASLWWGFVEELALACCIAPEPRVNLKHASQINQE